MTETLFHLTVENLTAPPDLQLWLAPVIEPQKISLWIKVTSKRYSRGWSCRRPIAWLTQGHGFYPVPHRKGKKKKAQINTGV